MKDQIQLHEIAGYLPYGLHIKHNEGARLIICGAFKKYNRDDFFTYSLLNWPKDVKSIEAMPILRPMSYLTKEVTHNGETFVPVDWFEIGDNDNKSEEYTHGNIKLIQILKTIAKYNVFHDVLHLPHGVVKKLYEWHFDIHNLIGRNLAVSIHSIKQ